jgi:hopanoid-associated phosphorylase
VSLLVATGLRAEARILGGPGVQLFTGGGRSEALEAALTAAAPNARAILSIGLGGALCGDLRPGDWVVAEAVIEGRQPCATDPAWSRALVERLPGARRGVLLGSDAMLTGVQEKARARVEWGALAVDMESHAAARVARRFGLRFAAARVISDAADRELPAAVRVGMRPDGGMAAGAVIAALARDPAQLPALIRTGWEARLALRRLAEARRLLGPGLGLADLLELPLDMA